MFALPLGVVNVITLLLYAYLCWNSCYFYSCYIGRAKQAKRSLSQIRIRHSALNCDLLTLLEFTSKSRVQGKEG